MISAIKVPYLTEIAMGLPDRESIVDSAEPLPSLLRPNDVARLLAVSRAWVYEAARTGRIPSLRLGSEDGPLRFLAADIDKWLADSRANWRPGRSWAPNTGSWRGADPRGAYSRPAVAALAVLRDSLGDRFLGGDRAGGDDVALQVPVVALGGADVGVSELALHVHQ